MMDEFSTDVLGELAHAVSDKEGPNGEKVGVIAVVFITPDDKFVMDIVSPMPPHISSQLLKQAIDNMVPIEEATEDATLLFINPKD